MRRLRLIFLYCLLVVILYANSAICREDNACVALNSKSPICKGDLIFTESSCCAAICEKSVSWDYYYYGCIADTLNLGRVLHGQGKDENPVIIKLKVEKGKQVKLKALYSNTEILLTRVGKEDCIIAKQD